MRLRAGRRALVLASALAFVACNERAVDDGGGGSQSGTGSNDATDSDQGQTSIASTASVDTTEGPASATDDPTGSTAPPPPAACNCQGPTPEGCNAEARAEWIPGCSTEAPCPYLTVECPRPGGDLYDCQSELAYDEAALTCILEALRDRTVGRYEMDGLVDYGVFSGQSRYLLHVVDDQTLTRVGCLPGDVGFETYGPSSLTPAAPDHFESCLGLASAAERYDCLFEGMLDPTDLPACGG